MPAALGLLLAWVQFADRVALVTALLPLGIVAAVSAARSAVAAGRRPRFPGRLTRSPGSSWPGGPRDQDDRGPRLSGRLPRPGSRPEPFWPAGPADHENTGPRAPRASRAEPGDHRARTPGAWRAGEYEITLIGAAIGAIAVAWAAARVLDAAGGFAAHPLPFTLAPLSQLWTHAWLTGWGILELYGANFLGVTGAPGLAFACLHLTGLALATAGCAAVLRRFLRHQSTLRRSALRRPTQSRPTQSRPTQGWPTQGWPTRPRPPSDLVDSVLAVAIVANLVSYALSTAPGTVLGTGYDAREIAAVLPLGAVLAGRVFGPWIAEQVLGARPFSGPRAPVRVAHGDETS